MGTLIHKGTFSITLEFTNTSLNIKWACTSVYGPNDRTLKFEFWNELRTVRNLHELSWLICGDFNTSFTFNDKNNGIPNPREIANAQQFLGDLNLIDPPLHGRKFTWTNGQPNPLWVRLDRFLYTHDWPLFFPRTIQSSFPRIGSDHSPIYLDFGNHYTRSRIFRFEKSWYSNDLLESLIQGWWSDQNPVGCGAYIITKKFAYLKSKLRLWAKENFGASNIHKKSLLADLNSLDTIRESRNLSEDESTRFAHIQSELHILLKQEEIYWKQRSRITWLKEGDANTKYFHLLANGRRNKNFIPRIRSNGNWIEGNQEIGKNFTDHFQNLIGTPIPHRFLLNWHHLFNFKDRVDLSSLELPFSFDEIKNAVFDLNADKAPVDNSQSGFIKGRCIADNIIAAQEVIFNLQKRKILGYALKVDFAKAFDSLDWNFLLEILEARGFGNRWISWIHTILKSAKTQILINGTTQGYIRCKRGLRQEFVVPEAWVAGAFLIFRNSIKPYLANGGGNSLLHQIHAGP
ncbi:uncharacterized protein LOC120278673 [Dioscorea cayenensis subsp. rotundata]|uniref:Uncharacterized protein LOC120278673 n=1 Tax=Dioscorea cayennensis subsp. rotundata TaxID=55577 RepID=A0AB40CMN2_DIOCR|nr:uncharacterized protein LOC120278673 [Dioscorea cayenensis subsp. rotundata]